MTCKQARIELTAGGTGDVGPELHRHLGECSGCTAFARRIDVARQLLRTHHGRIEPDQGFADRVVARLPVQRDELLGWAAWRLLPATMALLAVLVWVAWSVPSESAGVVPGGPTDDPLGWVLTADGDS